jgi:chromosome segregation ATPase
MLNFYTDKAAKEEIANLNERLEALDADHHAASRAAQSQIETLSGENKDLVEKVTTLEGENTEKVERIETLEGELATTTETLTAAQEELGTFEDRVEAGVLAKFESLGGEPLKRSEKLDDQGGDQKLLTRANFNNLSPAERTEFAKSGGRLKN